MASKKTTNCSNLQVEYIKMAGYPVENIYVTTSDGYILNIHRIPTGKQGETNGKVVLLEHGFLASSVQWVLTDPGRGLGKTITQFSQQAVLVVLPTKFLNFRQYFKVT